MDEKGRKHGYYVEHKEKWVEYTRRWNENNKEKRKEIKKKYCSSEHGKKKNQEYQAEYRKRNRDAIREKNREYWAKHKEQKAEKDRRYREKHREELNKKKRERYANDKKLRKLHHARTAVNQAIRYGDLERGLCEVCGAKAEAHHDDYNRPLNVRWLCIEHHREWHKKNTPKY